MKPRARIASREVIRGDRRTQDLKHGADRGITVGTDSARSYESRWPQQAEQRPIGNLFVRASRRGVHNRTPRPTRGQSERQAATPWDLKLKRFGNLAFVHPG